MEIINPSYLQLEQIHRSPIRPSYDARRSLCKWISRSSQSSCSRETINRLHLPHACPSIQRINHPITVGPPSWAFQSKLPNCRARLHWTCLKLNSIALCQASLLSTELHHVVPHCTFTQHKKRWTMDFYHNKSGLEWNAKVQQVLDSMYWVLSFNELSNRWLDFPHTIESPSLKIVFWSSLRGAVKNVLADFFR